MEGTSFRGTVTGLAAAALAGAAAVGLGWQTLDSWPGLGAVDLATGTGWCSTAAATGLAGWVWAVLTAGALRVLPGDGGLAVGVRSIASRLAPRASRWVAGALLVGAGVSVAAPAQAAPVAATAVSAPTEVDAAEVDSSDGGGTTDEPGETRESSVPQPTWDPLPPGDPADEAPEGVETDGDERGDGTGAARASWVPEPPTPGPAPASPDLVASTQRRTPVPAEAAGSEIVVRRGDTLWGIAARHLGPEATPTQIAHEWPRWWAANRDLVGHDPDRLLPGQVLTAPGSAR